MKLKLLGFLLLIFSSGVFAQNGYGDFSEPINISSRKRALKQARKNAENADYSEAIQRYRALLKTEPDNIIYNTELGMTFFDSPYQKVMCIPYLEKAIKNGKPEIVGELYYPLGIAYRMSGQYEKAVESFGMYLNQLKAFGSYLERKEEQLLLDEINRELEICNTAKSMRTGPPFFLVKDSVEFYPKLKRLPAPVNSIYDEYSPIFTNNDSTIIFTARRKGGKGEKVNWDGKFFEDIWISDKKGDTWSEPRSAGDKVNTSGHDAVNSISKDKKKLYIYRADKNGSILVSDLEGRSSWGEPKRLPGDVNSRSWETSLGISLYDSIIYFVSDKSGGYGGRDIYISRRNAKGEWDQGTNLGQHINTPFDEDAPFLSTDGMYLYFASTGHNTMGGFDIFRSALQQNGFSAPENLGPPINTENHDIYLTFSDNGEKAWLSSQRITNDTLNDMNLYELDFECKTILATNLIGSVKSKDQQPVKTRIAAIEKLSGKSIASADTDNNGFYRLKLTPDKNYHLVIEAETFKPETAEVFLPKQCKAFDLYQMITLDKIKEDGRFTRQETTVTNGFFDIRKQSGSKGGELSHADYSKFLRSEEAKKNAGYSETVYKQQIKEADIIPVAEVSFVNILFDYNSAQLRQESREILDKVAAFMKNQKDAELELWGYADTKGTEEFNLKLSEKRAKAAREYLMKKGVKKSRLNYKGLGESNPVAKEDSEAAYQQNRRVEFKVYPKGKDAEGTKK